MIIEYKTVQLAIVFQDTLIKEIQTQFVEV
jgi:hypothetical protein